MIYMDVSTYLNNLQGRKNLSEDEVKSILLEYKIPTTKFQILSISEDISKHEGVLT
jgi:hypothetical protein